MHENKDKDADATSPTFTAAAADRTLAAVTLPRVSRDRHYFNALPKKLANLCYYVPDVPNFPLIDGFTADIDDTTRSATLWLFQMTTSRRHEGSEKAYAEIHRLMANLKSSPDDSRGNDAPQAKKAKVEAYTVTVRYVLVCPQAASTARSWKMPKGWNQNNILNNHQGEVYLLEVQV